MKCSKYRILCDTIQLMCAHPGPAAEPERIEHNNHKKTRLMTGLTPLKKKPGSTTNVHSGTDSERSSSNFQLVRHPGRPVLVCTPYLDLELLSVCIIIMGSSSKCKMFPENLAGTRIKA